MSGFLSSGCMMMHGHRNEDSHAEHSKSEITAGTDLKNSHESKVSPETSDTRPEKEHKLSKKSRKWAILGGIGMGVMMVLMMAL